MKRLSDFLIVLVLGTVVLCGGVYAAFSIQEYDLSVNQVYGDAVRACEEDERICSFSSVESAQRYLDSPEHKASLAMREVKKEQDAAASNTTSAVIGSTKHEKSRRIVHKPD